MSKDIYISYIVELIRKHGFTSANSAFNFHITDDNRPKPTKAITQFKEYWKIAQEQYKEAQILINKQKEEEYIAKEKERQKTLNISREDFISSIIGEIKNLEDIISKGYLVRKFNIEGKQEIKKELFGVSELEKLHRILDNKREQLKKILGYDAPTKIDTTIKNQGVVDYEID